MHTRTNFNRLTTLTGLHKMMNGYKAEGLAMLTAIEELIQSDSVTDEQKAGLTLVLRKFSFWRDESNPSPRKANRAARGKRPYK